MTTSIAFTGDICFTHYFKELERYEDILETNVRDFLKNADYGVGNIEGAIFDKQINDQKEFLHYSSGKTKDFLKNSGISIWNLANNHIFDFGDKGIETTINNSTKTNCKTIGIWEKEEENKPLIINRDGGIGFYSVTYAESNMKSYVGKYKYTDWNDFPAIEKRIKQIKKTCKWCVIIVHGGEEFSNMPMPDTRTKYLKYLDLGADIVIAHHPHAVQNYEYVNNKIVFYSLGNFIFDTDYERVHSNTDIGIIIKIYFTEHQFEWEYMPVKIDREKHRVCEADKPSIFINIDSKMYINLWPFAAKALFKAEKATLAYLIPSKYQNTNSLVWFIRDIRLFRHRENRNKIFGKYKASFTYASREAVVDYIINKY